MKMVKVSLKLKRLEGLIDRATKKDMGAIGLRALELNHDQISKELDRKGKKFEGYSPAYAEKKGVSAHPVTLVSNAKTRPKGGINQTGHMLSEYGIVRRTRDYVVLGWTNTENKRKAAANFESREFVGLTVDNKRKLIKYIRALLMGN